jgi:hypothetical protein
MKPLGLSLGLTDGVPTMSVHHPSPVEDKVWEAVEAATIAGWTPERFRDEAAEAWAEQLRDDIKHARKVLS